MTEETPHILVADDDADIRNLLELRLTKSGYRVTTVEDGDEALNSTIKLKPDLVVLDVMMPGQTGWDVARAIRANEALSQTGVLILTAVGDSSNALNSPSSGADDFLDKPFEFAELKAKIGAILEKRQG